MRGLRLSLIVLPDHRKADHVATVGCCAGVVAAAEKRAVGAAVRRSGDPRVQRKIRRYIDGRRGFDHAMHDIPLYARRVEGVIARLNAYLERFIPITLIDGIAACHPRVLRFSGGLTDADVDIRHVCRWVINLQAERRMV